MVAVSWSFASVKVCILQQNALPNPILTVVLHDWVRDFDGTLARTLGASWSGRGSGLRAI
jgi:hypothetical protein